MNIIICIIQFKLYYKEMFQSYQSISNQSQSLPPNIHEEINVNSLRDSISSLTHRINEIQFAINKKMDRSQCLSICQKKVSYNHLKHYLDQLQNKIIQQNEQKYAKMQEISSQKISQMSKRIKNISFNKPPVRNQQKQSNSKSKEPKLLSQELYLESNQTMFSLIIEQITKLQEKDQQLEKFLENRNKKMINLNNQVCKKLQKLQISIDQKINSNNQITQTKGFGTSWSILQRNSKTTVPIQKVYQQRTSIALQSDNMRIETLHKNIESLQKEMLGKMNIKDVLPIVKQQTNQFYQSIDQIKQYIEQNTENTRKILSSQTQINRQISLGLRIGYWHSYQQQHEIAILNKQLINLLPEVFQFDNTSNTNYINIAQQGLYIIKILPFNIQKPDFGDQQSSYEEQNQFEIMIGTKIYSVQRQTVFYLQKNSQLRLILRKNIEILISIQKF